MHFYLDPNAMQCLSEIPFYFFEKILKIINKAFSAVRTYPKRPYFPIYNNSCQDNIEGKAGKEQENGSEV